MKRVDSSNIWAIGYDPGERTLFVQFHTPGPIAAAGAVYCYFGVGAHVHKALLAAASKGHYLREHVQGNYPYGLRCECLRMVDIPALKCKGCGGTGWRMVER